MKPCIFFKTGLEIRFVTFTCRLLVTLGVMTEEHEELRSFAAHSLNSIDSSYPLVSGRKSRCNLKTIIFGFLISFTIVISVIALIKSGGRNKPVVSEKDLKRLLTLLSNETVDGLRDDLIKTLDQKIDAKFYKAHTDFNNALAAINETIREDIIGNITNLHQKQVTIGTAVDEIHKIVLSTNFGKKGLFCFLCSLSAYE